MATFLGMHVSRAKHSYAWLPRKCDYRTDTHTHTQTDRQTDARQSDPFVPLCFAGDTKIEECMCHLRNIAMCDYQESVTTGQTHTHTHT